VVCGIRDLQNTLINTQPSFYRQFNFTAEPRTKASFFRCCGARYVIHSHCERTRKGNSSANAPSPFPPGYWPGLLGYSVHNS